MLRRLEPLAQCAAREQCIEQLLLLRRGFVEAGQHHTRWACDGARVDLLANNVRQSRVIGRPDTFNAPVVLTGPIDKYTRVGHRGVTPHLRGHVPLMRERPSVSRQSGTRCG